jgi:hypothetical protein
MEDDFRRGHSEAGAIKGIGSVSRELAVGLAFGSEGH